MITYAGIPLTEPTDADVRDHLARWWHLHAADDWDRQGFLAEGLSRLPVPYPPTRKSPPPGVLSWPNGASSFAVFRQFVTSGQLGDIRTAVGTSPTAKPLMMDDGVNEPLSTDLYLLLAKPVLQLSADGTQDYYLLTLADVRYFWWQKGDQTAPSAAALWSSLLSALFTAVGESPTLPTIPAAYGVPDPDKWNVGYRPIPPLIDAACRAVGLRTVRQLDGTVEVVQYADAATADDDNWAAHGGELLTGGRLSGADVARGLPASVAVVFPGDTPAVGTKTLASLSLTVAGGVSGVSGAVGQVVADLDADADATDRDDYRDQAAEDWYSWQFALTDAAFRGIRSWVPTGLEDRVEWVHDAAADTLVITRVIRPPAADQNVYGDRSADSSGAGTGTGTCEGLAALESTDCLLLTVTSAAGRCAGVATGQELTLAYDSGVWTTADVLETDAGDWAVEYQWPDGSCCPTLCLTYVPGSDDSCSEELADRPDLTLTVDDGPNAGTYTMTWVEAESRWRAETPGARVVLYHDGDGWHFGPAAGSPVDAGTTACEPFTADFGSVIGSTGASVENTSFGGSGSGTDPTTVCLRYLGCSGGRQRFVGSGSELCGGTRASACGDNSFVVEVECVACPVTTVNPDCTGGAAVSSRLYVTFSGGNANCALNGLTVEINYEAGTGYWKGSYCIDPGSELVLTCLSPDPADWRFTMACSVVCGVCVDTGAPSPYVQPGATLSPYYLEFADVPVTAGANSFGETACVGGTIDVIISETPP